MKMTRQPSLIMTEVSEWTSRIQVIKEQESELKILQMAWEVKRIKLDPKSSPRSILRSAASSPMLSPIQTTKRVSFGRVSSNSSADSLLLPPVLDIVTYVKVDDETDDEDDDEDVTIMPGAMLPQSVASAKADALPRTSSLSYLHTLSRMRG
eukprot:TRINITY_DN546_c0_g1_i5.p1 TRINITY_DN546_c0_g1~~TRINITY_DN546_c0_g1_i5.p1  ORF type:complete len:152 (+),score=30.48 TRINITY_DN546_c0_g1_i5:71-526(+)